MDNKSDNELRTKELQTKNNSKNQIIIAVVLTTLVFGIIGIFQLFSMFGSKINQGASINFSNSNENSSFSKQSDSNSIESVASRVSQSVVSIVGKSQRSLRYFSSSVETASAGTGIIVSENGYILTNKHVVSKASEISVVTSDGNSYDNVKVVSTDPLNDIAILKISNAKGLKAAELGDSKKLNIGQQVIAIGNALGEYDGTVTSGIISGVGRTVVAADGAGSNKEMLTDMIQTDAAINTGNSGGPLVNAQGQVIGINTAVASSGQGIGFAIPISSVKGMLKSISKGETPKRAYLGANYVAVTPQIQKEYKLTVSKGALIKSRVRSRNAIISDSPAQQAGLQEGDVITKIDGVEISKNTSLGSLIGEKNVGDKIQITYIRNGQEKTTSVILEEYQK